MGFFGFKRKKDVIDLTERYNKQQEKLNNSETISSSTSDTGGLGFFASMANSAKSANTEQESAEYADLSSGFEDKKKKLAKRLIDMTDKLEDLGNQIYHLQQRIELLEKKCGIR